MCWGSTQLSTKRATDVDQCVSDSLQNQCAPRKTLTWYSLIPDPSDEMAVRQRFFNSTEPFSGLPKAELKGSYPSCSSSEQDIEEGKDTKKCSLSVPEWGVFPLFTKLITRGTAEQVGESPIKTSTIIAQAECEYLYLVLLISHKNVRRLSLTSGCVV